MPATPRRRLAPHGRERGVSIIIVALLLTVLLSAAAFAVDLGAAFTERRHDQNTADAAVMSGAVEAVIGGGVINDVVAEVRDKVDITLARTVSAADWENCKDPDQLTYTTRELQSGNPTIDPVTDCISFSISFDRVRVKLPDQQVQAVFAPALGFGTLKTNASAEAEVVNGAGLGAPPFVALSTATQGDFVCLRTSSNPQPQQLLNGNGPGQAKTVGNRADPCDKTVYDVDSENFGTLSPYRYEEGCTRQNADVEYAISLGIDHIMGYFADGFTGTLGVANDTDKIDGGASCTVAYPDTFRIDTGFNAQGLRCALLSEKNSTVCNGVEPRLKPADASTPQTTFAGEAMENSAPWDYLRSAQDLYDEYAPDACVVLAASRTTDDFDPYYDAGIHYFPFPTSYDIYGNPTAYTDVNMEHITDADWDHYDRYDAFVECLQQWGVNGNGSPVLFDIAIGASPRFAFIPKVAEPNLNSVTYVHIESFLPTFMYRLYQAKSSGATPCDSTDPRATVPFYEHDAGQVFTSPCADPNSNVDRLSSIILSCGMVSSKLCNKDTGEPDFAGQDIYEFRLAK